MTLEPSDSEGEILFAAGDLWTEIVSRGWSEAAPAFQAAGQHPDLVRDAVAAFLDVGVRIVVTLTEQANPLCLPPGQADDSDADALDASNRAAVESCRRAIEDQSKSDCRVMGVLGPPVGLIELDEVDRDRLRGAYERQARALVDGGVDGILCQAFTEADALAIAVAAAASVFDGPVLGGMTFDCGPERTETTLGVTVPQACTVVTEAGGTLFGCDSGVDPDSASAAVELARVSCDLPVWVTIRSGGPELIEGRVAYPETPGQFGERLAALADAGVRVVQGAAGATPEHMAALIEAEARRSSKRKKGRA